MANPHLHNPHFNGDPFLWKGGKTGILLMHGLTATPSEVRTFAERLRDQGFSVAGPLLPGHGTTPKELNSTGWADWLAEGTRVYKQLHETCDHVFVGGESTGAAVALYMATQFPEIAGLLTYAPAIKLNLSWQDVIKMYVAAPFLPSVPKGSIDVSEKWQGYPVNPLKAGISLVKLGKLVRGRLDQIHQPVLVMQGRLDTTVHPSAGDIIISGIRSKLKEHYWMEQSSHVILLDRELDEVTKLTVNFIDRALAKSSKTTSTIKEI